jgi:uncharacterized phage protein (TIGR02220 family)
MNHSFDIAHAKIYGVDEAIMITNFQWWLKKNWANDKHKHDGRTWTYNSVASFEKLFPYWTGKQIRRILESLVTQGVLMRGEYNKSVYDRTSWYAFVDEATFLFENIELPKWESQDSGMGTPIPNINTNNKPNNKPNNKEEDLREKIEAIIARINQHAGTSFRADTKESARMISARLKTYTLQEALRVVDAMATKWLKTDMRQHYVPTTLFRESNFEKYLQMASDHIPSNTGYVQTANNPDYKLGKFRYRPQSEFGSYTQYLKNCEQYGHTPKEQGHD